MNERALSRLLKPAVFIACLLPALHLAAGAFGVAGMSLGADPVVVLLHTCGKWTLNFLLITLCMSPLRVLGSVVEAAGGMPVMMDSGIRRGTDVMKALALGAAFVFVGRPFNFAASIAGEEGVRHAYEILQGELYRGMAQLGITSLTQLAPGMLMRIGGVRAPGMPV